MSALFELKDKEEKLDFRFIQFHSKHRVQQKFHNIWDQVSQMFWSITNLVVDYEEKFEWDEEGRRLAFYSGPGGKH